MYKAILVNKENKIKANILKKINLIETTNIDNEKIQIEEETYQSYIKLKEHLKTKNIMIGIASAYRSLEYQQQVYNDFINRYGEKYATKVVAPIGCSEHHTGLAIDLGIKINNEWLPDNYALMEHEKMFTEIHKCLTEFGFILRYPKDKEKITGYPYEPWHIRYVGKVIAKIMVENNWTLEEYLKLFSGVIVVNKEKNMTSFDVVNEISHIYGIKKVGHTGTLDPLAEGVLIVAIGKATKIVELLTAYDKEYIAGVKLGVKTDTYDITGKVIEKEKPKENLKIEKTLQQFKKTYFQEVPIYSAIKVNGKKLYEYARNNQKVELPKKEVTIKKITLLNQSKETFTFKALVTKGCYIRSLINDIGKELNTYATMTSLIRTKQGKITLEDAYTLDEIKENKSRIYKIEEVLNYKLITITDKEEFKVSNGVAIDNKWQIKDKVIFRNKNNQLIGIYQKKQDKLVTWKNFI